MAPVDWGDTSIVYNPDKVDWVKPGEESFSLLWDERMKGKLPLWTLRQTHGTFMLLLLDLMLRNGKYHKS